MGTAANIQFVQNKNVVIHQEDLQIGPLQKLNVPIHVSYIMENIGTLPETIQIAFPLPGCSFDLYVQATLNNRVSATDTCIKEPKMHLKVDEKPILDGQWTTLFSINGVSFSQTQESKKSGLVAEDLVKTLNMMPEIPDEKTKKQEKAFQQQLGKLCTLLGGKFTTSYECSAFRKISAQRVFLWKYTFTPKKRVKVEHNYDVESSHNLDVREEFKTDQFCLKDPSIFKAWKKYNASLHEADVGQNFVGYILKTGANWAAPIAEFNLTIKKENAQQYVSTCFDGLKKVGSLEFKAQRKNFLPKEDLFVLFFRGDDPSPRSTP